jgi:acyl carrier protein
MAELLDEIRAQIASLARTRPELVTDDMHLIADLGMSSMDLLGLLAFVEDRYQVMIPDRELGGLVSIRKIVAKLDELRTAA